jgi:hypothetical protein
VLCECNFRRDAMSGSNNQLTKQVHDYEHKRRTVPTDSQSVSNADTLWDYKHTANIIKNGGCTHLRNDFSENDDTDGGDDYGSESVTAEDVVQEDWQRFVDNLR